MVGILTEEMCSGKGEEEKCGNSVYFFIEILRGYVRLKIINGFVKWNDATIDV